MEVWKKQLPGLGLNRTFKELKLNTMDDITVGTTSLNRTFKELKLRK